MASTEACNSDKPLPEYCLRLSSVIRYSHHRRSHRRAQNLRPSVVIDVVRCRTGCCNTQDSKLLHLQIG